MNPQIAAANAAGVMKKGEDRPTKVLPTERVQFTKQLSVLRAYAAVSGQSNKDAKIAEVASTVGLNGSTVSLCNGFFVDVGLLERVANGGFTPAPEVHAYLRAYNWQPEASAHSLAPKLRGAWFFKRIQPKLAMGSISETDAVRDLAEAAAAAKKYQAQLAMLLDFMEAAGLIRRDGGVVREGPTARQDAADPMRGPSHDGVPPAPTPTRTVHTSDAAYGGETATAHGVRFNIEVNADMAEISTWSADRITAFFSGIAQVLAAKKGDIKP